MYHRSYHMVRGHMGDSGHRDSATSNVGEKLQFPKSKSCRAGSQVSGMKAPWIKSINEANKQRG